eukprot:g17098.t1
MNEGNQITVYKYTGDPVLKMEPWNSDRAASPPRDGEKRVKGLPTSAAPGTAYAPVTNAYRPRNAEGGSVNTVAAMMRGEVAIPEGPPRERTEPWETKPVAAPLDAHEIRRMEKEAKKLAEQKEKDRGSERAEAAGTQGFGAGREGYQEEEHTTKSLLKVRPL